MNQPHIFIPLISIGILFAGSGLASLFRSRRSWPVFSNIAEGTHAGAVTKQADGAITTRYLLGKIGSDINHVAVCGASDRPLGVLTDEAAAAEYYINVNLFGSAESTQRMVASEAITAGDLVYTAANGKVQNEPASAGTYYLVGRAITAAGADGDTIEVDTQEPIRVVVIDTLGNTNNEIGALTFSSTPTQAEAEALRDKAEELADDVRAIAAALTEPALVKIL